MIGEVDKVSFKGNCPRKTYSYMVFAYESFGANREVGYSVVTINCEGKCILVLWLAKVFILVRLRRGVGSEGRNVAFV